MKKWDKTTIIWDLPLHLKTNVLIDDWHKKEKVLFHHIHGLRGTQLPDRKGLIQIEILRECIAPTTKRDEIRDKLLSLSTPEKTIYLTDKIYDMKFKLTFDLVSGENFCISAIDVVERIFEVFGVEDERNYCISNFVVFQETQVKVKKEWMPFADYLRHKKGFPRLVILTRAGEVSKLII